MVLRGTLNQTLELMKADTVMEIHEAWEAWQKEFDYLSDMEKGMGLFQQRLIDDLEEKIAWCVKNLEFLKANEKQNNAKELMSQYAGQILSYRAFLHLIRTIKPKVHGDANQGTVQPQAGAETK
jgi:hypothetical protein